MRTIQLGKQEPFAGNPRVAGVPVRGKKFSMALLNCLGACGIFSAMAYYYVIPFFLTLVFVASYWLVNILLWIFDRLNFFWDWWDDLRRSFGPVAYLEVVILVGFVIYIVKWELSGTP